MSDVFIKVVDLYKSFGDNHVLKGIDVEFPRSKITVIIGGSGSGKSVLVKHLLGLLYPDSGQVFFDGKDITQFSPEQMQAHRGRFGMLFQMGALFDSMNVEDNIAFPVREHKKMTEEQALHRVDELLTILNIPNIQNRMPSDLSGGMRKRVALARALIMEPEVMLYDEPTTGLDPVMIKQVDEMIHTAAETNPGLTSIVISHDMASTFRISDQIVMLHLGKIVESGSPEVVVKSKVPQVQEFIEAAYAKPKGM